jgi:putative ABC transport system ATP-binding protein
VSDAEVVLSVTGATRQRGGDDGFRLEVPRLGVRRGECIAITGPSGCGKSTLLDLLGLVLRPDRCAAFEMRTRDNRVVDVARLWRHDDRDGLAQVRAQHIGYVLQTGGLLPFLPVIENIRLSRVLLGLGNGDGLVERLAEALKIGHLLGKKPQALSIGERQRVAIARALAHRPAFLLADEPTAALDPAHALQVMKLLLAIVQHFQITAIIVSHDWELVRSLGLRQVRAEPGSSEAFAVTRFDG